MVTSPLTVVEQTSRFRAARIPEWTQPFMADGAPEPRALAKRAVGDVVGKWEQHLVDGLILRSSNMDFRGRGLWMMGRRDVDVLAAMLLQRHLLLDTIQSGRYLTEDEFLAGEAPDGTRVERAYTVDLLVLTKVGENYRAASGWADAMVTSLISERLDEGLPTLVCSTRGFDKALSADPILMAEAFAAVTFTKQKETA